MKHIYELCAFADEAAETLTGQISAMKACGINWLEIRGVDGKNISKLSNSEACKARSKLDRAGIQVWAIGSPTGKIDISENFEPHMDEFRHMVELAGILGASHYRLFSFYGAKSSIARDIVMERLDIIAKTADGSGITLCHENEKDIYGETAEYCVDIHKTIPKIKAVFDPANFIQAGQNVITAWDLLQPYVEYLHIKDARKNGSLVPAGLGDAQIEELIERYGHIGGGMLTLEPHLSYFSGLENLERDTRSLVGADGVRQYPSQRAAFDVAAEALKKILVGA